MIISQECRGMYCSKGERESHTERVKWGPWAYGDPSHSVFLSQNVVLITSLEGSLVMWILKKTQKTTKQNKIGKNINRALLSSFSAAGIYPNTAIPCVNQATSVELKKNKIFLKRFKFIKGFLNFSALLEKCSHPLLIFSQHLLLYGIIQSQHTDTGP